MNTFDRFGVAVARLIDAGRRLRTSGRAATTNGRIWFCTIGVLGLASVDRGGVGGRERAARPAAGSASPGRAMFGERLHLLERRGRLAAACPGGRRRARLMFWFGDANALEHLDARVDQLDDLRAAWRPALCSARCSELTSWRRAAPRSATAWFSRARSRWVGSNRSSTWASSVPPLPFSPCPAPLTSRSRYCARVGVERGEDLVEVDVRHGVGDRDRVTRAWRPARCRSAGAELDEHVLQPGLRAQQRGRVCVDQVLVLLVDVASARPRSRSSA